MYKKCENYPAEEAINLCFALPTDPEDDETDEEFSIESGNVIYLIHCLALVKMWSLPIPFREIDIPSGQSQIIVGQIRIGGCMGDR
ncbi:hypothetical protein TNIN_498461 [Trichonephila inaurata madagascariensis]|uniref:Uncharacterized protein n=1 Tax=Trichonephila inaurata madagascariensis TaxID=2747483 RepID=A0A8X7CTC0_9ARAC|nr:hypothetical protein TNIN_498461 [Trichonephila inaurata madagascariensis]